MSKIIKIRIPAQTVTVDAEAWALEYGVDLSAVREDVKAQFAGTFQQIIDGLPSQQKRQDK